MFNTEWLSDLEAAKNFEKKRKNNKKRTNLGDFSVRKNEALKKQKIRSLIDFDKEYSSSIKSITIEQSTKFNLITRDLNDKILMFSKVSV